MPLRGLGRTCLILAASAAVALLPSPGPAEKAIIAGTSPGTEDAKCTIARDGGGLFSSSDSGLATMMVLGAILVAAMLGVVIAMRGARELLQLESTQRPKAPPSPPENLLLPPSPPSEDSVEERLDQDLDDIQEQAFACLQANALFKFEDAVDRQREAVMDAEVDASANNEYEAAMNREYERILRAAEA